MLQTLDIHMFEKNKSLFIPWTKRNAWVHSVGELQDIEIDGKGN